MVFCCLCVLSLRFLLIICQFSVYQVCRGRRYTGDTRMCSFRQQKHTHSSYIYLNSEGLRTHHWEEHVLPEELLRHELSEVSKVS